MWEAHKPYLRGRLIKHGARRKKKMTESKMKELIQEIKRLELQHKNGVHIPQGSNLAARRRELTGILTFRAKAALVRCRKRYYEPGDKGERLLAKAFKGQQEIFSLLNVDLKLLTRILADHLLPCLMDIVDLDKVGFMPAREARDNIIKVLDLIHRLLHPYPKPFLSYRCGKGFL